ncbi:MAG: DUF3006 domain-containing protein [Coriobacteriia bacterium]|nr:DUF3006 domain-containing protein [Coriobacteriia bacterium]
MQAIVDRIEGDMAVLEIDGERFIDVPLNEMPEGCAQGDVFEGEPGCWRKDDDAKAERLRINSSLMAKLFKD